MKYNSVLCTIKLVSFVKIYKKTVSLKNKNNEVYNYTFLEFVNNFLKYGSKLKFFNMLLKIVEYLYDKIFIYRCQISYLTEILYNLVVNHFYLNINFLFNLILKFLNIYFFYSIVKAPKLKKNKKKDQKEFKMTQIYLRPRRRPFILIKIIWFKALRLRYHTIFFSLYKAFVDLFLNYKNS